MNTSKTEGYIKMRNSQKLDNNWLWSLYREQGGKITNSNEFLAHFYFIQSPISFNGEVIGYEKTQRDLSGFFTEMDGKFGLQTLWSAENKFIKVAM